jgi:hypothetical protein
MAIKTGRYGSVYWSVSGGASPTRLISLNTWKLSLKTDYEDVTTFGDTNKVYIPGMRDISGSLGGFWDSDDVDLVQASEAVTPGLLELEPNTQEPGFVFSGLAYLDLDIDCQVNAAPKVTSQFRAAAPWTVPVGSP